MSFEEYHGTILPINDSIFYAKISKHTRQTAGKPKRGLRNDSFIFSCDNDLIGKQILIEYQNNTRDTHTITGTENIVKINPLAINYKTPKFSIAINQSAPILNEDIKIYGLFHSDIWLSQDRHYSDFYFILDSSRVKSLNYNDEISHGPHFDLKYLPIGRNLSGGRKIR